MIKFIDVKHSSKTSLFKITADCRNEHPATGDCIFMQGFVFNILQIDNLQNGRCRIIAKTDTQLMNDMDEWIESWEGNEFFCGKNKETYQSLSGRAKLKHATAIARHILPETASSYVEEHIELCLALFPDRNAPKEQLTKIGGLPTARKGFLFPQDKDGKSALFIGQINLKELDLESIAQLPAAGMLYFFGTIVVIDGQFHRLEEIIVRYVDETSGIETIALPDDLQEYGVFTEKRLLPMAEVSLPPDESTQRLELDLEDDENDAYDAFMAVINEYGVFDPPEGGYHDSIKLMGHPQQLNGCILIENMLKYSKLSRYSSDEEERKSVPAITHEFQKEALLWRHLFSFSVDEFLELSNFEGFQQHSDGIFNVLIKLSDLRNRDFSQVRTVYQQT